MGDSFWSACTDVVLALRRKDPDEAKAVLKKAEALIGDLAIDERYHSKRKSHLDTLRALVATAHPAGEARRNTGASVSFVDETVFYPRPLSLQARARLGVSSGDFLVVATHCTVANLQAAAELLKVRGSVARFVRARVGSDVSRSPDKSGRHVLELQAADENDLAEVFAAADALLYADEPPSPFDDSKRVSAFLQHFAMGRPVVVGPSRANTGIRHKRDALVLESITPSAIADAIQELRVAGELTRSLASSAADFYLRTAAEHRRVAGAVQVARTSRLATGVSEQSGGKASERAEQADSESLGSATEEEVTKLRRRIEALERDKAQLGERLRSMPSIDPLCLRDPTFAWVDTPREDFGIIVFGHTRLVELGAVLESLKRQEALQYTEVWLDGFQGNQSLRLKVDRTAALVKKYPVKHLHRQSGNFGFRKMLLLGLAEMCRKYRDILVLEDDCFPTRDAVAEFRNGLERIRERRDIFSVYGHHFRVEGESEAFPRFQGWGWATTSEKLMPKLRQLIDCYSMPEHEYLEFVRRVFTPDIRARIDITPPRLPSHCLEHFFAWDETLCLLTALANQMHIRTAKQTIYNCGMGTDSTHFDDTETFRRPPFNLITPDEVWQYF